jgi:hypothetical protein
MARNADSLETGDLAEQVKRGALANAQRDLELADEWDSATLADWNNWADLE